MLVYFHMEDIKQQLITAGYKLTTPRKSVLHKLTDVDTLISARELHQKIKKVDRASVYRTLNLLEKLHVVNVELIKKEKLYCLATQPHHHIICKKCGYIEKIECKHTFDTFKNFTNVHHQLTLTGICNQCN